MNHPLLKSIVLTAFLAGTACEAQNPPKPTGEVPTPDAGEVPSDAKTAGATAGATGVPKDPRAGRPEVTRLRTGAPNDWFDHTQLQMGDHLRKEVVRGKFKFKNPLKKAVEWSNLTGSCQCAKVVIQVGDHKYELSKRPKNNSLHRIEVENGAEVRKPVSRIVIGPEEEGEVEAHMEMADVQGIKEASVQFATTDKKYPLMLLKWEAMGIKLFNITPSDYFLNDLKWKDEKVFRFVVTSSVKKDFKLLDHDPLPEFVKVQKKQIKLPNGDPAWEVSGTFGPKADPNSGGASIKFKTDLDNKVLTLNVIANVSGPISITPGTFISLGRIKRGKGISKEVTIIANEDFELKVDKVEFEGLTHDQKYLQVEPVRDGRKVKVKLTVLPEVKGGLILRGKMILHLNHPAAKTKTFSFNGILR